MEADIASDTPPSSRRKSLSVVLRATGRRETGAIKKVRVSAASAAPSAKTRIIRVQAAIVRAGISVDVTRSQGKE